MAYHLLGKWKSQCKTSNSHLLRFVGPEIANFPTEGKKNLLADVEISVFQYTHCWIPCVYKSQAIIVSTCLLPQLNICTSLSSWNKKPWKHGGCQSLVRNRHDRQEAIFFMRWKIRKHYVYIKAWTLLRNLWGMPYVQRCFIWSYLNTCDQFQGKGRHWWRGCASLSQVAKVNVSNHRDLFFSCFYPHWMQ